MPEDGMGLDVESDEDRVSGFAGRLEVIEGPSGRRSWPDVVKAQIVRESFEAGVTVSEVARRHRMSPQHLTFWRRAAREGRLTLSADRDDNAGGCGFVPLAIDAGRCVSAWNKDPAFGVIGIQSGPRH